jgi:monoamine oxidase
VIYIYINEHFIQIDYTTNIVLFIYSSDETFSAKYVIVAIPPVMAAKIGFTPALNPHRTRLMPVNHNK